MKVCGKCKCSKELTEFYSDKSKNDGLRTICKECTKEYQSRKEVIERRNNVRNESYRIKNGYYERNTSEAIEERKLKSIELRKIRSNNWSNKNLSYYKEWKRRKSITDPISYRAASKVWAKNNKENSRERCMRRNASKKNATPSWANISSMREIYQLAKLKESETGIKYHVDHIVPLNSSMVCGLHCEHNLQVITAFDNVSKGNRYWDGMS